MLLELNYSPLTDEEIANAPKVPEPEDLVPILPVPADAPPMAYRHPEHGPPIATWAYHDADGRLLGYMLRFASADGRKVFSPLTYCKSADEEAWRAKGFPAPYPLYNARELAQRPDATVLVVHGEKAAEAARELFPQYVVTTSPFGHTLTQNASWSALENRNVIIAPDHSAEGDAMTKAYTKVISQVGALTIRVLTPKLLATSTWQEGRRVRRPAIPIGWDLSNASKDGWTADQIAAELGDASDLKQVEVPLKLARQGIADFFLTEGGLEAEMFVGKNLRREWLCPAIEIVAMVRDTDGMNWSKLIGFKTSDNKSKSLVIPSSLFASEGGLLREILLGAGLPVSSTRFARERLTEYLSRVESPLRRLRADRIGWHDGVFVTANKTFGVHPSGEPIEYAGTDKSKVGQTAGTLEDWKANVAALATGSSKLVFGLCCAFAAPLLYLTNSESGGFHFVGASSIGKTTVLQIAGSVWGGGGLDGYIKPWRLTDNGLEGVAGSHCDTLLCLDEIAQVSGEHVDKIVYMISGNTSKIRSKPFGGARTPITWRVNLLSSGEMTLQAKIGEAKGKAKITPGHLVRFIDLVADAGKGMGLFESLAGFESPEVLARNLKKASAKHYGTAGLAFIGYLATDIYSSADMAETFMGAFITSLFIPEEADGQVRRVARRFALVAAAGEMAIAAGIVPWPKGTANAAAKTLYDEWLANRGGVEAQEIRLIMEQVRYYLHSHAQRMISPDKDEHGPKSAASLGFIKIMPNGTRCFCFPDEVWSHDVCEGRDPDRVAQILMEKGYLMTEGNRTTKTAWFAGESVRVHAIKESILTVTSEAPALDLKAQLQHSMAPVK
jgi:putative DNA primase/helicase